MPLTHQAKQVLRALVTGSTLKSHRYLDGTKTFKLHGLDDTEQTITRQVVDELLHATYVTSNQKFPAATYMLTPEGRATAVNLGNK